MFGRELDQLHRPLAVEAEASLGVIEARPASSLFHLPISAPSVNGSNLYSVTLGSSARAVTGRVALLYLLGDRWACRIRCGLAYRSELELKGYRGQMMAQKIQSRLGGDRSGFEFPDKPRSMHWRTYGAGVKSMRLPSRSRGAVFGGRGSRGGSVSGSGLNAAQRRITACQIAPAPRRPPGGRSPSVIVWTPSSGRTPSVLVIENERFCLGTGQQSRIIGKTFDASGPRPASFPEYPGTSRGISVPGIDQ